MGIGRFRERVSIYEDIRDQPDGLGGWNTTRVLVGTFWARFEQGDGDRILEGNRVTNHSPYTFTVRSGTYKITTNNILVWDDIEMTIESTRYQTDKRWTIIQVNANE